MRVSGISNFYQTNESNYKTKCFNFRNSKKISNLNLLKEKNNLSDILFFSGSFNPIHNAHIAIVKNIKEKLGCKKAILVPTYSSYHKATDLNVSFEDKMTMTELAIKDLDGFEVSDVDRQANSDKSYSYNTVKKYIENFEGKKIGEKLNFLTGADSFATLNKWYKFKELANLVKFIIVTRLGEIEPAETVKNLKNDIPDLDYEIFNEKISISSTTIRKCIKNDEQADKYLDNKVLQYIKEHKLYV